MLLCVFFLPSDQQELSSNVSMGPGHFCRSIFLQKRIFFNSDKNEKETKIIA